MNNKRPFFSIIIPAYNSRKYIRRLLESINKNYCKDMIEIIIVDDKSTESYKDVLNEFNLNIYYFENDEHRKAPVWGRQKGADLARGEWITFIDHDDYFEPYTFDKVKETIDEQNLNTSYIITHINCINSDNTFRKESYPMNWTHGKFYNMDNFWNKYDLHYDLSLTHSEDIYLSVQAFTKCIVFNLEPIFLDWVSYNYVLHDESLSHEPNYIPDSMCDYMNSTIGQYLYYWNKYPECHDRLEIEIFSDWYHFYFHIQSMIYDYIDPSKQILLLKKYFYKTLEALQIDGDEFIRKTEDEYYYQFHRDREFVKNQHEFIERQSFYDFVNYLQTVKESDKDSIADSLFYSKKKGNIKNEDNSK